MEHFVLWLIELLLAWTFLSITAGRALESCSRTSCYVRACMEENHMVNSQVIVIYFLSIYHVSVWILLLSEYFHSKHEMHKTYS